MLKTQTCKVWEGLQEQIRNASSVVNIHSATGLQTFPTAPRIKKEHWRETAWQCSKRRKENKCEFTNPIPRSRNQGCGERMELQAASWLWLLPMELKRQANHSNSSLASQKSQPRVYRHQLNPLGLNHSSVRPTEVWRLNKPQMSSHRKRCLLSSTSS